MFRDANDRPVTASSSTDVGVPAQRRRVSREEYAKKPTPCAQCAAQLTYEQAVKYAGKFCTTECQFEYRRGIPSPEECDPNVSRHCARCAAPLNRLQISRKAKHCGESCRHEAWVDKAREERKSAAPHSGLDYQKQPMQKCTASPNEIA